eukprot:CAMPEP_0114985790 /NCGR_PEP_ID=MMETSP0216-20121206/8067_1 /TAXON_ID=223996 /ORGANISM="Protocruzia adherens, Strain Boccale" /LENGTH=214 /DNA_ID=CAMNT_0002348155 /DNA_START=31 /DNA_END=675 /DNA_ORIENTATION=+
MEEDYHFKFKIVIVGDKGVGKTTLLDTISNNYGKVLENEQSSEVHVKTLGYLDDNTLFRIVYWDLPGSEHHQKFISKYCMGATAALFLFDASKRSSFERVENWIMELEKCDIPTQVLVGNKIDLVGSKKAQNAVNKSEPVGLARKYGMEYFETCATGESSIAQVYDHIFTSVINSIPNPPDPGDLLGKGIVLGKRLTSSVKFRQALFDPNYDFD